MSELDLLQRLTLVVAVCSAFGCATIMAPGPDRVPVSTNPPGARVFVDDHLVGETPVVVDLDRWHSKGEFQLELLGFEPFHITRTKSINGWFWGNILLGGGLIGILVDAAAGNVLRFDDSPISVGLVPSDGRGVALPAPTTACQEERHRILVEAKKIEDKYERIKMINSAPTCK
jgi:PEGA domain